MKKLIPPVLLCAVLLSTAAGGESLPQAGAYARVLSSRPVLSLVQVSHAYRECPLPQLAAEAPALQRCNTTMIPREESRIESYDVTYLYNGRVYRTRMPYDPGSRVPLRAGVHAVRE